MVNPLCLGARRVWLNRPDAEPKDFPPSVSGHLAVCAGCRDHYSMIRGIDSGLRRMPLLRPSESFVPRVMRAITMPVIRPVQGWDPKWNLTVAVAASILLLTTANYFTQGPGNPMVTDAASGAEHLYGNIRALLKGLI